MEKEKPLSEFKFDKGKVFTGYFLDDRITAVGCKLFGTIPADNPFTSEAKISSLLVHTLLCKNLYLCSKVNTRMTHRVLRDNQLTGTIPDWVATTNLSLKYLFVYYELTPHFLASNICSIHFISLSAET